MSEKIVPTIGVAIITKNAKESLQRLLSQLKELDQVVVVDTGSSDGTVNYVKKLGKPFELHKFKWLPAPVNDDTNGWGFSAARNHSISKITTDYWFWIDSDDVIVRKVGNKEIVLDSTQVAAVFRNIVSKQPDLDHWFIDYLYSHDENGNVNVAYHRERLFKTASGWRCVYPIHECFVPSKPPQWADIGDIAISHLPGEKEETAAERNMRMLKLWLDQMLELNSDHPDLPRARLLIGDTLWAEEKWRECADWLFKEFIQKHPHTIDLERWQAWNFIFKCHYELENMEAAKLAALQCIEIKPNLPDGYYNLAKVKLAVDAPPDEIFVLLEMGAKMDEPPSMVVKNPLDYSFTPFLMLAECKYRQGSWEQALKFANNALSTCPNDRRAETMRAKCSEAVRRVDAKNASIALYQILNDFEENEKAAKLFDLLPYVSQEDEDIRAVAKIALDRVRHMRSDEEYANLYLTNSHWTPSPEAWLDDPPSKARYEWMLSRIRKALPNGGTILDVGCSDGLGAIMLAREGYQVVGVDLDPRCVALANERAEKLGVPAKFTHGFFEKMEPSKIRDPFSGKSWFRNFDAVICMEVIEHVQDPSFLLGSLGDCAKDGAPILLTTPHEAFDKGDIPDWGGMAEPGGMEGHVRVFTQESFEFLMKSNPEFHVIESHFVAYESAYREEQGWQVGEIRRMPRPNGPTVRIYCGDMIMGPFLPETLEKEGIGGSETAVLAMAKYWSALGCQVVVYNGGMGIYDGIFFRPVKNYSPKHRSDIFIAWRNFAPILDARPNAGTVVLWVHDMHFQYDLKPEWIERIDKIAVLSEWHKNWITEHNPELNVPEKLWITRNGINAERYDKQIEKVPYRYFYSSSPDRGLDYLVSIWPDVRKQLPNAELHVAYGFESAIRINQTLNKHDEAKRLVAVRKIVNATEGVINHEKLNQKELAEMQMSCMAWLYPPNDFLETYCITALEAQAARCFPIIRLNGALPETVKNRIHWEEGDSIDLLVARLRKLEGIITVRRFETFGNLPDLDVNEKWAKSQTWASLAEEWLIELAPKEDVLQRHLVDIKS